ncbi:MAG: methionyl-tRNA formyltransferase [Bacteroidales bacterium]|nr:methionyl-tRNA formyltransferase [Bacteroidales bacterium]
MRIVFMGTPEFAVTILDHIIQAGHDIACVVTTPDKPAGRGQHLKFSDVKHYALEHQLTILQPVDLKAPEFISELHALDAEAFVVVAFRMLPESVYTIPPKGTFNVHASLLPQYRGAAPIQRAIINGETETGVTTFLLDKHTDTGDIIGQKKVEITREDNCGTLHDKLMFAGAELAVETLKKMESNMLTPVKQVNTEPLHPAPKIFKEDMRIHWNDTAENIYNLVRGLSPYPGAYTTLTEKKSGKSVQLKVFQSSISNTKSGQNPGFMRITGHKKWEISTKTSDILVEKIQIEGKKPMNIQDFLAGFHPENYTENLI